MARQFVSGSTNYITVNGSAGLASKISFGGWFNPSVQPATTLQDKSIVNRENSATTQRNYGLDYRVRANAGPTFIEAFWTSGGSFAEYYAQVSLTNGTWYHILFVVDFTQNPYVPALYVNGVAQTLSQTGITSGTPDTTSQAITVGGNALHNSELCDGSIAEVFAVGGLITANEAAALAQGARAREVLSRISAAGGSIDFYLPLGITGDSATEVDLSGNARTFTFSSNVPAIVPHPPISQFTRPPPRFLDQAGTTASLTGAGMSSAAGSFTDTIVKAITGASAIASAGNITTGGNATVSLTGAAGVGSAGSFAETVTVGLPGAAMAAAAAGVNETVVVLASATTGMVASAGSFADTISDAFTGAAATAQAGTIVPITAAALSSAAATASAGALFSKIAIAVPGASGQALAGFLLPPNSSATTLAGAAAHASAGIVTAHIFNPSTTVRTGFDIHGASHAAIDPTLDDD